MYLRNFVRFLIFFLLLLVMRSLVLYFLPPLKIGELPLSALLEMLFTLFMLGILVLAVQIVVNFCRAQYSRLPFLSDMVWNLAFILFLLLAYHPFLQLFVSAPPLSATLVRLIFLLSVLIFVFRLGWIFFHNLDQLLENFKLLPGLSEKLSKTCSRCAHQNPAVARYCEECGERLPEKLINCPSCGARLSSQGKYCLTCGKAVSSKQ